MLLICFSVSVTGSSIKLLTRIADKGLLQLTVLVTLVWGLVQLTSLTHGGHYKHADACKYGC